MGKVRITDRDGIRIEAIEGDDALVRQLAALQPGQVVDLEVAGTVASWERVNGTLAAMRPVEAAENAWAVLRGQAAIVEIRPFPTPTHLATLEQRLYRWDIPENRIY